MNGRDISELLKLASTGQRELFIERLTDVVDQAVADQLKPCFRETYAGAVRPTNLIDLAPADGQSVSCFYELASEANPSKVMGQISSEIKRASPKGAGSPQTELIYAYVARTGVAFKALKVTYIRSGQ